MGGDVAGWLAVSPLHRAARLAGCIVAGAALYFAVLFLTGLRPSQLRSSGGHS
jgi:hypothetical protein